MLIDSSRSRDWSRAALALFCFALWFSGPLGLRAQDAPAVAASVQNAATEPAAAAPTALDPGHNAWLMVSTALVLFMSLPGLYGHIPLRRICTKSFCLPYRECW